MAEKNRVFFKTVEEAEAAGYKRAGTCPEELQTSSATPAVASSMSTTTSTSSAANVAEPTVALKSLPAQPDTIIGNKNSKVYQLPGCAGYKLVTEKNQVRFESAAEAKKAGFKLAGDCIVKNAQTSRN